MLTLTILALTFPFVALAVVAGWQAMFAADTTRRADSRRVMREVLRFLHR